MQKDSHIFSTQTMTINTWSSAWWKLNLTPCLLSFFSFFQLETPLQFKNTIKQDSWKTKSVKQTSLTEVKGKRHWKVL